MYEILKRSLVNRGQTEDVIVDSTTGLPIDGAKRLRCLGPNARIKLIVVPKGEYISYLKDHAAHVPMDPIDAKDRYTKMKQAGIDSPSAIEALMVISGKSASTVYRWLNLQGPEGTIVVPTKPRRIRTISNLSIPQRDKMIAEVLSYIVKEMPMDPATKQLTLASAAGDETITKHYIIVEEINGIKVVKVDLSTKSSLECLISLLSKLSAKAPQ